MNRQSSLNALINKRIFISVFFAFIALNASLYAYPQYENNIRIPRDTMSVLVFIIALMINYSMPKRELLVSKDSRTMLYGLIMFSAFEVICGITGIVDFMDQRSFYKFGIHIALTLTLFLSARIMLAYDLKIPFLRLVLFPAGIVLTVSYFIHFDGFSFISTISQILSLNRYRNAFGFIYVNHAGASSCFFIILTYIYKAALTEKGIRYKHDTFYKYISVIRIIAVMMLLSTGTRAGITSVLLYALVYVFLRKYSHNSSTANAVFFVFVLLVFVASMIVVDYWWLIQQSKRLENFFVLAKVSLKAWLVGYGYFSSSGEGLNMIKSLSLDVTGLDSLYASTVVHTGLIGFLLFFGSVTKCILSLFRDIKNMTELQIAVGALCAIFYYYSLSEGIFFTYSWYTFTFWLMLISVVNEQEAERRKVFMPYRKHVRS